ncbi:MAG: 1,4-alpha-glucan branching protein GlgB [Chloroflexota bacterium]|nr:1,4-alpha-glucan branching protein GlgB [Chloroflexota bacterium]
MAANIHPDAIKTLVSGDHGAPYDILGPQQVGAKEVSVRTLRPWAYSVTLVEENGAQHNMQRIHDAGLFEVTIAGRKETLKYHFEARSNGSTVDVYHDPYAIPPQLGELDLHLLAEGKDLLSYRKLGAHIREVEGMKGVHFAVWAPNAYHVSVIGNFNRWDARVHPMTMRGQGFWELFIPGVEEGAVYRYEVRSRNLGWRGEKSDPYAFFNEVRPANASVVFDIERYQWNDSAWMAKRAESKVLAQPMSVYEVHLGSWRRSADGQWLGYRDAAHELATYCKDMGYTHIELMPVAEHPFDGSWGYQVTGYFAPTSRYGDPLDFKYFVDHLHQNGIGIIVDWVPAHFPKDGHALAYFDGTHLYEHADPRQGEHPDWGTLIFNFGRNEVRNFLLSNALFWLNEYHIDGLRVDAVSSMLYLDFSRKQGEWIPNEYGSNENLAAISFLREFNEVVHREAPGAITVAEESTAWAMVSRPTYVGGLGFTFKWNMGWMHDTLEYFHKDPIYRRYHHGMITFSMIYAFNENFVLALSHDEVVHGKGALLDKMPGDMWQRFANLRTLLGYQYMHPGKKLNFMGAEFGQWQEWRFAQSLDWHLLEYPMHQGIQHWVRDLNHVYSEQPALYEHDFDAAGFRWVSVNDADGSTLAFLRYADDPSDFVLTVCNFTPVPRQEYRVGVPEAGFYAELLNSDANVYGGSNMGNAGGVQSEEIEAHNFPNSINLVLPPLAIVVLKLKR